MSAPVVYTLEEKHLFQVREIFFESSTRKKFEDEKSREAFFEKYLGHYLTHFPSLAKVATLKDKVLGYVVAAPRTDDKDLFVLQPHLKLFIHHFDKFPSHLHMNCDISARGQGVGSLLIETIVQELIHQNIKGLHVMTGPNSQNRSFYRKQGFIFEAEEDFHGSAILFMGRVMSTNSL
jgi:GNAT superfamily N-acetyltransferase